MLGAGLTGTIAAGFLARAGHRVILLDRTREVSPGRLLLDRRSWSLLAELGWQGALQRSDTCRRATGLELVGRLDAVTLQEGPEIVLLDRGCAVAELRRAAVDQGVSWLVGYAAAVPLWDQRRIIGVRARDGAGRERTFEARIVVDATGPLSFMAAALGQLAPRRGPRRSRLAATATSIGARGDQLVVVLSQGHWLQRCDSGEGGVGGVVVMNAESDAAHVVEGLPPFVAEALGGPLHGLRTLTEGVGQHLLAQAGEGWVAVGTAAGCGGPGLPGRAATGVVGASLAAWEADLVLSAGRSPAAGQFGATVSHARRAIALGSLLERALARAAENGLLGWAAATGFRRRQLAAMLAGDWGPDVGRLGRSWYLWRLDRVSRLAARSAGRVR